MSCCDRTGSPLRSGSPRSLNVQPLFSITSVHSRNKSNIEVEMERPPHACAAPFSEEAPDQIRHTFGWLTMSPFSFLLWRIAALTDCWEHLRKPASNGRTCSEAVLCQHSAQHAVNTVHSMPSCVNTVYSMPSCVNTEHSMLVCWSVPSS